MADDNVRVRKQFEAGVKVIKNLPKNGSFMPSNELLLKFYGYYKQATCGECHTSRPGFFDMIGRAKWDAWNSLGSMSKEDAMRCYVNELKQIIEVMPQTDEVNSLVNELDHFYQLVDIHTGQLVTSHSSGESEIRTAAAAAETEFSSTDTATPHSSDQSQYQKPDVLSSAVQSQTRTSECGQQSLTGEEDEDEEEYLDSSDMLPHCASCKSDVSRLPSIPKYCPANDCCQACRGVSECSCSQTLSDVRQLVKEAVREQQLQFTSLQQRLTLLERIVVNHRKESTSERHCGQSMTVVQQIKKYMTVQNILLFIWPLVVSWLTHRLARRRRTH